jgi:hypothetical protein
VNTVEWNEGKEASELRSLVATEAKGGVSPLMGDSASSATSDLAFFLRTTDSKNIFFFGL